MKLYLFASTALGLPNVGPRTGLRERAVRLGYRCSDANKNSGLS
jgi:hypothetical protein